MKNNLGNKEIMASNIKFYMDKHGIDRNDLCRSLNIKYTTLADWLNAKTYPRIDKIEKLANYFNISKADLVEPRGENKSSNYIKLPVIGAIAGRIPIEAIEDWTTDEWEEIPQEWLRGGNEFIALRVTGDSMEPRIADNDIAIIKKQPTFNSGEICAVYVNGYNATLKKILKLPDESVILQPLNTSYEPQVYTKQQQEDLPVVVLGKLVELRAKF